MSVNKDKCSIKEVQNKILFIMKYIDKICRENDIEYFIMGGTALGAIRHGGFIPWDDDLDIFMTPQNYEKFKSMFLNENNPLFYLQEWKTTSKHLEYAKVRLNGTTFIEEAFKDDRNMHQGIYVDIMILHKCPKCRLVQKILYYKCKYVTLYAISKRNWKPKTRGQKFALSMLKLLPNKIIVKSFYKSIYKYDYKEMSDYNWFYWITPANFSAGLFEKRFFENAQDIVFEDTVLKGAAEIEEYLKARYGDYKTLPPEEKRKEAIHALFYDVDNDYKEYFKDFSDN